VTVTPSATLVAESVRQGLALSDAIAITLIEQHADRTRDGWLDVRPLVSEHEVSGLTADIRRGLLAYADVRPLITRHPHQGHLVRIVRRP
jgi:hypothetical protein